MIFVLFETSHGGRMLFVGANLQSVLDDTNGGGEFGGTKIISRRTLEVDKAEATGARYLADGIRAVRQHKTASYCADAGL